MTQPSDLASQLLRFEQRLKAYQQLHEDELAELWQVLNECKRTIADLVDECATAPKTVRVGVGEEE